MQNTKVTNEQTFVLKFHIPRTCAGHKLVTLSKIKQCENKYLTIFFKKNHIDINNYQTKNQIYSNLKYEEIKIHSKNTYKSDL